MQRYSIVLSMYGWSARNVRTNKTFGTEFEKTPPNVVSDLIRLMRPGHKVVCVASTINVGDDSEFHKWFINVL